MTGIIPAAAVLISFCTAYLLGYPTIPLLKRLKFGQTIREVGPAWHKSKEGTPTMGGVLIIIGFIIGTAAAMGIALWMKEETLINEFNRSLSFTKIFAGFGLALIMGLIGFIDDYIKVVKKRNLGLTALQKTVLQALACATYLISLAFAGLKTTWIPFVGEVSVVSGFGIIFWPIAFFFIYGFTNAVNLTDGIDGLASTVTLVVACAFMLGSGFLYNMGINALSASLAGACVGFIVWNAKPAKVFMGDTGSMFLGGAVVALSFGIGRPVLLIFAGITYLLEALSDVIQVAYYKKTKKRIFKMAPLHHHFEMCGWSEQKIVYVFSGIAAIGCVIALLPIIFNW